MNKNAKINNTKNGENSSIKQTEINASKELNQPQLIDNSSQKRKLSVDDFIYDFPFEINNPYVEEDEDDCKCIVKYVFPDELSIKMFELMTTDDVLRPILAKFDPWRFTIRFAWF